MTSSHEPIEVTVEKIAFGGQGIARKDGLVYFIPFSAPGDRLMVRVTDEKKNFRTAEIQEILSPGPERVTPPCPVYGRCGGCNLQHISYEEQLRQKQNLVLEQLKKNLTTDTEILPIVPSPTPFHYRNRIQLKFDGQRLGFYERKSHTIIDLEDCLICDDRLTAQFSDLKKSLSEKKQPAPKVELFLNTENQVESSLSDSGPTEGLGFSQVNQAQNINLTSTLKQWISEDPSEKIYDFYAGAGNFTFPLLDQFRRSTVHSVELSEKSVKDAKRRILEMNLSPKRVQFFCSDVGAFLKRVILQDDSIAILDPPRVGCADQVIHSLAPQNLKKIYYISCNPSTLARDLTLLKNWKIGRLQAFDMFPQTDHIEVLAELVIDSR